jgi:coniferyl-aldehyde dehydrogenase
MIKSMGATQKMSVIKQPDEIAPRLAAMRAAFLREGLPSAEVRINRLDRIIGLMREHQQDFIRAVAEDFGTRSATQTRLTDIAHSIISMQYAKEHVRSWMQPQRAEQPFPGVKASISYQPLGVVGIISPWNFPLVLALAPLAGVLAAGNRAMLKPSELTSATSELLGRLIAERFDPDELAVVLGNPEMGATFAGQPFDHLVFTGGASIGRQILRAASENRVPVTLELGGKNPVVLSQSADLEMAAERVMTVKTFNAGQICQAPDYLLLPHENVDEFVDKARGAVRRMYPSVIGNPDYTSIISERHYRRLQALMEDAERRGGKLINFQGENEPTVRAEGRKISPTLVLNTSPEMRVCNEEIFGPLLPVVTYKSFDDAVRYINGKEQPLAIYYFGKAASEQQYILERTTSGALVINDVMSHVFAESLPFGGVGASGMGAYHGRFGFERFSYARAVVIQSPGGESNLLMRPPYGSAASTTLDELIGVKAA